MQGHLMSYQFSHSLAITHFASLLSERWMSYWSGILARAALWMERELCSFLFTYNLSLIVLGLGLLQIHQAWRVHYTGTFYKFWQLIYFQKSLSTKKHIYLRPRHNSWSNNKSSRINCKISINMSVFSSYIDSWKYNALRSQNRDKKYIYFFN